jgi:propionyl-CoA synthetase
MIQRRIAKFFVSYESAFRSAVVDPVAYWRGEAKRVQWHSFPKTTLRVDDLHFYKWFPDGSMNITEQCLDVHLQDRPHQVAYFVESPITGYVKIQPA